MPQRPVPSWFRDAKFGIFVHWGPYAVPAAFNEWYPRNMYQPHRPEYRWHKKHFGDQGKFGYKDFIPRFKAGKFKAQAWARLFKQAGAKYAVLTAEHHDGFAMYASSHTPWNAALMGPRRDVLGEFAKAVRAEGLAFGASSHLAFNWWYFRKRAHHDTADPANWGLYGANPDVSKSRKPLPRKLWWDHFRGTRPSKAFLREWWLRTTEIVENYRPKLMYFDWCWGQPDWRKLRPAFMKRYYSKVKGAALIYKEQALPQGSAIWDVERGAAEKALPRAWQADTSVSWNSWSHIRHDRFKDAGRLIQSLCDIVSKNGNLLLNVGPQADGRIPAKVKGLLGKIGAWLKVNGEAVYGTRPWKHFGEGPSLAPAKEDRKFRFTEKDVRYTAKGRRVYAMVLGGKRQELLLRQLRGLQVAQVELLGSKKPLLWSQGADGLRVWLPASTSPVQVINVHRKRLKMYRL